MVWTCRAQHRLDCRSTQAECGCTEKIWQAKEIMGWSAWEWQKEARYGFCWPSKSFWVERTPSRKTCQKAQPSVEENRALKWIWWWWPWRLFHVWTSLFGIMNQYDPTHDLKINVGHHDQYFMVQWFYVIAWRLFDVRTASLGIMGQHDWTSDLKLNVCHCDLYFMVHWFCLISQTLMDECHIFR